MGWIAAGFLYAGMAIIIATFQLVYNRIVGRSDPHYAEAWFVGAFWFPLLVWVLAERLVRAIAHKAKASSHANP